LEFIRNHYEAELSTAEEYIVRVKQILSRIGKSIRQSEHVETVQGKRGRKPNVAVKRKESIKRGSTSSSVSTTLSKNIKRRGRPKKNVPTPESSQVLEPIKKETKISLKPKGGNSKKVVKKALQTIIPAKKTALKPKVKPLAVPTEEANQLPKKV
jgi:hypothetical protein